MTCGPRGPHGDAQSPFGNRPVVSVVGDAVLTGSGATYELSLRGSDLSPKLIVRRHRPRLPLPDSLVQALRSSLEEGFASASGVPQNILDNLLNAMTDPDLLPDSLPAIGGAFLDDQPRIWVSEYLTSYDRWNQEDAWHVLGPNGHPLARLVLPSNSRLVAVRGDRVALIMRDELEVQHLRVFQISKNP